MLNVTNHQNITAINQMPEDQIFKSIPDIEREFNLDLKTNDSKISLHNFIQVANMALKPEAPIAFTKKDIKQPSLQSLARYCIDEFGLTQQNAFKLLSLCNSSEASHSGRQWWFDSFSLVSMSVWSKPNPQVMNLVKILVDTSGVTNNLSDYSEPVITHKTLCNFFIKESLNVDSANISILNMLNKVNLVISADSELTPNENKKGLNPPISPSIQLTKVTDPDEELRLAYQIYYSKEESSITTNMINCFDLQNISPFTRAILVLVIKDNRLSLDSKSISKLVSFDSIAQEKAFFDSAISSPISADSQSVYLFLKSIEYIRFSKFTLERNFYKLFNASFLAHGLDVHLALTKLLTKIELSEKLNQDKIARLIFAEDNLINNMTIKVYIIEFWAKTTFINPQSEELANYYLTQNTMSNSSPEYIPLYSKLVGGFLRRKYLNPIAQADFARYLSANNFFLDIRLADYELLELRQLNDKVPYLKKLPAVTDAIFENIEKFSICDSRVEGIQIIFANLLIKLTQTNPDLSLSQRLSICRVLSNTRFNGMIVQSMIAHLVLSNILGEEVEVANTLREVKEDFYRILPELQITRSQDQILLAKSITKDKGVEYLKYILSRWIISLPTFNQIFVELVSPGIALPKLATKYDFTDYFQPAFYHDFDLVTTEDDTSTKLITRGINFYYTLSGCGIAGTLCNENGIPVFLITLIKDIPLQNYPSLLSRFERLTDSTISEFLNTLLINFSIGDLKIYSVDPNQVQGCYPKLLDLRSGAVDFSIMPVWVRFLADESFDLKDYRCSKVINICYSLFDGEDTLEIDNKSNEFEQEKSSRHHHFIDFYKKALRMLLRSRGDAFRLTTDIIEDVKIKDKLDQYLISQYLADDKYKKLIDKHWNDLKFDEKFKLAYLFGQIAKNGALGYHFNLNQDQSNKANTILALACRYCLELLINEVGADLGYTQADISRLIKEPGYQPRQLVNKPLLQSKLIRLCEIYSFLVAGVCIESESYKLTENEFYDVAVTKLWEKKV